MKKRIDMEYENSLILVEKPTDKVTLITLNNPPLSLVTLGLSRELKETLLRPGQDDEVRMAVLIGPGEKVSCVGSDVKGFPLAWDDVTGKKLQEENEVFNVTEFLDKSVIVAMKGNICGGGYKMAIACDLGILSKSGRIAQPEVNLGVFPGSEGIFRLPKLVGASRAMEMMFLGEFIDAGDCLCLGLANRLAPASKTISVALNLAERITHKLFEATKLIKKGIREIGIVSSDKRPYKNLEFSRGIFKTEDCKEGVDALLGKRSPQSR